MKILISGEIGYSLTVAAIRTQLQAAKGADLNIHISSPGGSVYDGIEMYNLIRDYRRDNPSARIGITIKGLAASMASYIACCPAADYVVAEDNAVFMIHNAWTCASGDHNELMKTVEVLKSLSGLMGKAYVERTGKSSEEIEALMDTETWYFGEEIKTAGFVHDIIKAEDGDKDKTAALAAGRVKFQAATARMSAGGMAREDIQKTAAILNIPYFSTCISEALCETDIASKYESKFEGGE